MAPLRARILHRECNDTRNPHQRPLSHHWRPAAPAAWKTIAHSINALFWCSMVEHQSLWPTYELECPLLLGNHACRHGDDANIIRNPITAAHSSPQQLHADHGQLSTAQPPKRSTLVCWRVHSAADASNKNEERR